MIQYGITKNKFETTMSNIILKELPEILIKKYGILLQHESNTYNHKNNKRIDFILSKNDKYLFIELKSSNDSRLTNIDKMKEQLNGYSNSYNLMSYNLLIIFEVHKLQLKTRDKIKDIAIANNFQSHFINISS